MHYKAVFLSRFLVTHTNHLSLLAMVYTVTGTPDKNTAFYCTVGYSLFSPYIMLGFIYPLAQLQVSLLLFGYT